MLKTVVAVNTTASTGPNKRQVHQYLRTPGTSSSIGTDLGPQVFSTHDIYNQRRVPLYNQKVENEGEPEPQQQVQHFTIYSYAH